ncbi:MAG: hypothetical protein M1833_002712 [Piccolia ochrophora]|nr:MAG: hypothetical protein M1833_002712 [Piccolia ochrophora]
MPRKAFVADLDAAISTNTDQRISNIAVGEEDGTFTFQYTPAITGSEIIAVQALVPDVSAYPDDHQFLLFTTSENSPAAANEALEKLAGTLSLAPISISPLLAQVSRSLAKALSNGNEMDVDSDDLVMVEDSEDDDHDNQSYAGWSPRSPRAYDGLQGGGTLPATPAVPDPQKSARLRNDLRAAKDAGFKLSVLGGLQNGAPDGSVSLSCKIAKLGISHEAMQAWGLNAHQYMILVIRYRSGYASIERLVAEGNWSMLRSVDTRIGVSNHYKPSQTEVISAFSKPSTSSWQQSNEVNDNGMGHGRTGFRGLFISTPLNELMNERFVHLLKLRLQLGINWGGAEALYNDYQGKAMDGSESLDSKYYERDESRISLPPFVMADHLLDIAAASQPRSFPLLAAQFCLRHVVRCTEFCLVCHCKVDANFEALKPYVCSKPLCLYQYMSLGFGPSIEFEITSQPDVVDLLVSFCYASAVFGKLCHFPTGMSLVVPPVSSRISKPSQLSLLIKDTKQAALMPEPAAVTYRVTFDKQRSELIFQDTKESRAPCPVRVGEWIALTLGTNLMHAKETLHCRITETALYPTVKVAAISSSADGEPGKSGLVSSNVPHSVSSVVKRAASRSNTGSNQIPGPVGAALPMAAEFFVYDVNFDTLSDEDKRHSIIQILETLPTVSDMKTYLSHDASDQTTLSSWSYRLSPAALGILRWIIASNRSCIIQIDRDQDGSSVGQTEERIAGMSGWLQFRFAQGAPDKEQRFMDSLRESTKRLGLRHPSIFAWHGSPLGNWHGIVREGLHFDQMAHGRAYGHGCYHSLDFRTSAGYSNSFYPGDATARWPQSQLRIASAMCLNEIVNAPNEFISRTPHLVVAQLDWIQTRYLFVQSESSDLHAYPGYSNGSNQSVDEASTISHYPQDPGYTPLNSSGQPIVIPENALGRARWTQFQDLASESVSNGQYKVLQKGSKKMKLSEKVKQATVSRKPEKPEERIVINVDDDTDTIATSPSDNELLYPIDVDSESTSAKSKGKGKGRADKVLSSFVPGRLDHDTLQLLSAPSFATPSATKTLQREFQTLLKVQSAHPPHELGWSIDPAHLSTVYQWILELHSFDPELPLALDMQAKHVPSIVLEMRFGPDYPITPPFARVIRPRFRSFARRGGGHVTAGGALCMELLTNTGWSAVSSVESVLLQIRMAMSSTEPFPARLEDGPVSDYGIAEAVEAFVRSCRMHGWQVPKDVFQMGAEMGQETAAGSRY